MPAMRRRWGLATCGLMLAAGIGTVLRMIIPSAEYARHFDTIQVGMTEGDVHSILGGPPNDYAPSPYFVLVGRSNRTKYPTGEEELIWVFDGCFIEVFLN